jgi:hypothetical protein
MCDAALVFGYPEERRQIDVSLIQEVLGELEVTGVLPAPAAEPAAVPAAPVQRDVPETAGVLRAPAPSPALSRQTAARAARLDQREEAIRQRERELAEQRRVLAEEYRLLRSRNAAAAAPLTGEGAVRIPVAPARFTPARSERFWTRFKRVMLGASQPAVEEH